MSKIAFFLACLLFFPHQGYSFNVDSSKTLPVMHEGRVKPLDTVARSTLKSIYSKESISFKEEKISAIQWLWMMLSSSEQVNDIPIFRIDHPDLIHTLKLSPKKKVFSQNEISSQEKTIFSKAKEFEETPSTNLSTFQLSLVHLCEKLQIYHQLQNTLQFEDSPSAIQEFVYCTKLILAKSLTRQEKEELSMLSSRYEYMSNFSLFFPLFPLEDSPSWESIGQGVLSLRNNQSVHPAILPYLELIENIKEKKVENFNNNSLLINSYLTPYLNENTRLKTEVVFNSLAPFYYSTLLYLLTFLCLICYWLTSKQIFFKFSTFLVISAFLLHFLGVALRMYIEQRPPITNLYSSCLFVGFSGVLLSLLLEKIIRNSLGIACGACIGFFTLLISHYLNMQGDSMEPLRAVLDSNFWLSTHVVCITIGYSCTYLSGMLSNLYLLKTLFSPKKLLKKQNPMLNTLLALTCANIFFSFTGTILGGIWADQSWGRFWGWDPKENGALLIVIWNVMILHAKWGNIIKLPGLLYTLSLGTIVTSVSWFGVNMLGVGLHSYGFTDQSFMILISFITVQIGFVVLHWLISKIKLKP
jgi:ABC-type transport system involved in cytochrome c biogenesis permease subunit